MDNEELEGVKFSQFPSATPGDSDEVVGLHAGDNARFTVANFVLAIRQGLANIFVPKTDVGTANGVAELDASGKVPSSQLPTIPSSDITYDPTTSGASATNVQDAIDEVVDDVGGKQSTITASGILKGDGAGGVSAATPGTDYGTYSKPSGGIPASDLASGVIPSVPSAYTSNPAMDGTASPGTSNDYARGDHVHPVDTSRASASAVTSLNNRYTDNVGWIKDSDANNYKTSGMYPMATGNANVPSVWGILFVVAPRYDTVEQEYRYYDRVWRREYRNSAWSEWVQQIKPEAIAYLETGTTASRNYTAGQYIALNGLLYTADTAIANGATFYTSGGNKNLTECVGGGFNNLGGSVQTNSTEATVRYVKIGKMVVVSAYGTYVSNNRVVLGDIPEPQIKQFAIVYRNADTGSYSHAMVFQEGGTYKLSFYGVTPPTNTNFVCSFSYVSI